MLLLAADGKRNYLSAEKEKQMARENWKGSIDLRCALSYSGRVSAMWRPDSPVRLVDIILCPGSTSNELSTTVAPPRWATAGVWTCIEACLIQTISACWQVHLFQSLSWQWNFRLTSAMVNYRLLTRRSQKNTTTPPTVFTNTVLPKAL